ncbi:MAG TPA: MBOAT family O-acyltransferase [Phycisphaerae bacterium]|nr:MBOAT family O-acyltransferase [Phycisphaerae bacterium]
MILAAAVQFGFWADGFIRFVHEGYNLPRGPLGLLCYLPFVPIYWLLPQRRRSGYLWISSLVLAIVTLGPAYAAMMAALGLIAWAVVRGFGARGRLAPGALILAAVYGSLVLYPQPPWLPPVTEPVYFYIHWAGIGYLFLRSYHVLADVAGGRLNLPGFHDFLAYLLFAPTLRMGPIYRYGEFARQTAEGPAVHRSLARAAGRFLTGCIRLAAMSVLVADDRIRTLYDAPETLSALELVFYIQIPVLGLYLWISGYVDWSIAIGRLLGFAVPDNFNYPFRSASIDEFWRRWHITLSMWLKDFIFIPLVRHRWHFFWSFTLTFLFCGAWHGKYPCYVLGGLLQGLALAGRRWWDHLWKNQRQRSTPLYRGLERLGLVRTPLNTALCWLTTYTFVMVSLSLGLDARHAFSRVAARILSLLGLTF